MVVLLLSLLSCSGSSSEEKMSDAAPVLTDKGQGIPANDSMDVRASPIYYASLTNENCEAFLKDWDQNHRDRFVRMKTEWGEIVVELFDDVPLHAANFRYKIHRGYFSPTEMVRIVPEFVVQGGNSEEESAQELRWLIGKHTLPAEFTSEHLHFRGALAMGRTYQGNPDKRSSSYDFYLVVGRKVTSVELSQLQTEKGRTYTADQKKRYKNTGGSPHLDGEHTVFGQMISGWEVLDKLASLPTDNSDWPLQRVEVRMNLEP
jgi:peptidyl-prolyl cis-trans isomerase B (cyclophilin B)